MSSIIKSTTSPEWTRADLLRQLMVRVLGEVMFWLVIMQLVAGAYLQSQFALFDGQLRLSNGVPKMLLVLNIVMLATGAVVMHRGRIPMRRCMFPACLFSLYLIIDLAFLLATSSREPGAVIFGFNKYFMFFSVIPAAAVLRPVLTDRQMQARLLILLVPLAALALTQYIVNDPLLVIRSEENQFEIPAVEFYGQTRAFSLFRGVLECGQGMAFFGALLIARLFVDRRRHLLLNLGLLLLTAATCYVTFRRGAYMEYGAAAIAATVISMRSSLSRWLPWGFLLFGIVVAVGGPLLGSVSGDGVLSSESLEERHGAWGEAIEVWMLKGGLAPLLGTGLAQIEESAPDYFLVDNGFLAVGAQIGLIGVSLLIWVMLSLYRDMLQTGWQTNSALPMAVAALFSTWMMRSMFDPLFALYPLYAFLAFWAIYSVKPSRATVVWNRQVTR